MDDGIQQITRLVTLLLGFGIAEVLRGLARVWRIRVGAEAQTEGPRLGALVPLLGLLVILDQTSFLVTAVELQGHLPFDNLSLYGILVVIGGYYLISTFVFPARPAEWRSFNAYFTHVAPIVAGGIVAVNLVTLALEAAMAWRGVGLPMAMGAGGSGMGFGKPLWLVAELAFFPIVGALIFKPSRRVAFWLLVAANGLILLEAVWPIAAGLVHLSGRTQAADQVQGLFALLVGMSLAMLLGGFARSWRITVRVEDRGAKIRIGLLVPLLGLLVAFDQANFLITAVMLHQVIPFSFASLVGVLALVGGYYAISTFVFPHVPREWPDHDDYYLRVNRIVLGGMVIINVTVLVYTVIATIMGADPAWIDTPRSLVSQGVGLAVDLLAPPVMIILFFVKSPRANLVLLLVANGLAVVDAVSELF